jgi:hypothetical protein
LGWQIAAMASAILNSLQANFANIAGLQVKIA